MEENSGNETILANGTMSCSLNASEYVFMPEDKEGLRDCSPCILKSELNVSIVKTLAIQLAKKKYTAYNISPMYMRSL